MNNSLRAMIEFEGRKGNYLKNALDEGKFPSEEVVREIGSEQLFKLAKNTVEFRVRTTLEILASDYRLLALMEVYIADPENLQRDDLELDNMRQSIPQYKEECQRIQASLVRKVIQGYEYSW